MGIACNSECNSEMLVCSTFMIVAKPTVLVHRAEYNTTIIRVFQIYFNRNAFDLDCPDHMKKCQSGKCLPKSFFCDGENDCTTPERPIDKSEDEDRKSCGKMDETRIM